MLNNHLIAGAIITCGLLTISGVFSVSEEKAAPPTPPLKITVVPAQSEVTIGDWMVITLTLTNMTAGKMDIIKPMLDIDSVSFYIKNTPLSGNAGKSFGYSVITPSVYEHNRGQMAKISLEPGAEFKQTFKIPAATLGLWEITLYYQGFSKLLSAEPLKINVLPPKSDPPAGEAGKPEKLKDGELIANIDTSKGAMKCRFFFNDAPNTAMNFIRLAKEGFYDKLTFHRIVKGFMIQGGCPLGNGGGNPGYSIKGEFNAHKHLKGTLSMARSSHNDSAGSQFFICHGAVPRLDNQYTAFGELIEGTDVLDALASVKTFPNPNNPEEISKPVENVFIKFVSLEFKETETKK